MPSHAELESYLRHIRACRNISLPGARIAFRLAGQHVGWVAPPLAAALRARAEISAEPDGFNLADPVALPQLNRELAAQKFFHWRGEAFDVRATPDGPALAQMDRGALPAFGVEAQGVHLNGFVRNADGLHLWVAKRAANKTLDPGKLDHLIAGGVPTGFSPDQTLIKEAAEEAAIPAELAARARHVGLISYTMERPEGLRRDRLHCYDLDLPEDFLPVAADGEVESFALWPVARVREAVRDGEAFKFNVPLVLIDFFLRHGLIADPVAAALRRALDSP